MKNSPSNTKNALKFAYFYLLELEKDGYKIEGKPNKQKENRTNRVFSLVHPNGNYIKVFIYANPPEVFICKNGECVRHEKF